MYKFKSQGSKSTRGVYNMDVSGRRVSNQCQAGEVSGRRIGKQRPPKTGPDEQLPVCQVCERTGETTDASTFCVECNDHMCGNCARVHRGSRTSRRHQLLDKSQMPRKAFKARHICDTHPDTQIEYYCKKQDQLLCRHCIALNHQGCQGDDMITNVCDRVEYSEEFRRMYRGIEIIEQNITQQESKKKSNLAAIHTNRQKTKRDIDNFKKELYLFVDRVVDQMHEEVEGIVDTDKDAMAAVSEECDNVAAEVRDLQTEMYIKNQPKDKIQLFIVLKTAQQALEMLYYKIKSIDLQNRTRKYNFEPNKNILNMMRSVHKVGQLSADAEEPAQSTTVKAPLLTYLLTGVRKAPLQKLGQLSLKEEISAHSAAAGRAVKASEQKLEQLSVEGGKHAQSAAIVCAVTQRTNVAYTYTVDETEPGEHAMESFRDESIAWITGIESIYFNEIVIVDWNNYAVKILSLRQKRITCKLQMPYRPWDITKISNYTLAVTCPDVEYIQLVSVSRWSGSLSLGRHIQVQGRCHGIQYSGAGGGRMVVSFTRPGKVQVIDMLGTVLKDLSSDSAGTPLFSWPQYVALSPDGQCVYISDEESDTVTGITLDGRVVFTYRDDELECPAGLAVGDDGDIYVCGYRSHNIHMVSGVPKFRPEQDFRLEAAQNHSCEL